MKPHVWLNRRRLRLEPLEARAVPATGTLLVEAFDDLNRNGAWDSGESGVSGVLVNYSPNPPQSVTTGADGTATAAPEEGAYSYSASCPNPPFTFADGSTLIHGSFTVTAGQQTTVLLPLDRPAGTLSVQAFEDLNQDGSWQVGEPGVAGAQLNWSGPNTSVGSLTTAGDGVASATRPSGSYNYQATAPTDYTFVNPAASSGAFTLSDGQVTFVLLPMRALARVVAQPIIVNDLSDVTTPHNTTTLRDAITLANARMGPDTIDFQAGLSGTILLTTELPHVRDQVFIDGDDRITISRLAVLPTLPTLPPAPPIPVAEFSVLSFDMGADGSTIGGLTLTGGLATVGGGVNTVVPLAIKHCTIRDNEAIKNGGGIFGEQEAELTITGSAIMNNQAGISGGGIYLTGVARTLNVSASEISLNQATERGGGVFVDFTQEAALAPGVYVRFTNVWILINKATPANLGGVSEGGGVFMHVNGVSPPVNSVQAIFSECRLETNSASVGGGMSAQLKTSFDHCQIRENSATVRGGGLIGGQADMSLDTTTFFGGNIAPAGQGDGIAWLKGLGGVLDNRAWMGDDSVNEL